MSHQSRSTLPYIFSILLLILLFIPSKEVRGQESAEEASRGLIDFGFEYQWYPAGYIINFRGMHTLGDRGNLIFKLGHNFARREDFGKHDDERGGGPGLTGGYRYYLQSGKSGLYGEALLDIWFMKIDWIDNPGGGNVDFGSTDIIVLQPTIGAGYQYVTPNQYWAFDLSVAFGIEWNASTKGEPVGEGGITLIRGGIMYRW